MNYKQAALLCLVALALDSSWIPVASSDELVKVALTGVETLQLGPPEIPLTTFLAELNIGNPSQKFKFQFDINQPNLWVPTFSKFSTYELHYKNGFKCNESKTCQDLKQNLTFSHHNARMKADLIEDFIQLPEMPMLVRTKFAAITSVNVDYSKLPIDGSFGLAPSRSDSQETSSPLESLQQAGAIQHLKYGLWFDLATKKGELTLGGDNKARYLGSPTMLKSLLQQGWFFDLTKVSLGNNQLYQTTNKQTYTVIIDSTIRETLGQFIQVKEIYDLLGARMYNGVPLVDCQYRNGPDLKFTIQNSDVTFPAHNFIHQYDKSICYVNIFPFYSANQWTLGTDFLSTYYTIYDESTKLMGIAPKAA